MTIWNYFGLIGGLAVFLYGMLLMNKNLTAIAGNKLSKIMLTLTRGKVRGYLTGLGVTIINQSSSATTVLEAALVGAGLLTFQQSLAVTLGSELGSTFLGMDMMSKSLVPLRSYQPFLDLMARIENPILGVIIGLLFTMIVQSSGATSGLTIAMAMSGTITLSQAVPINMGAAVGTCITAVLGSLALNREAKRTAYIHIVFQSIGVVLVFILLSIPFRGDRLWLVIAKEFTSRVLGTESLARQIAMAHTFMSVINHIFIIPMLPLIIKFFNRIYPPMEIEKPFGVRYINDSLIETPEIALKLARKEILRGVEIVKVMFDDSVAVFKTRDVEKVREINNIEDNVDILRNEIIPFLTKLATKELTKKESEKEVTYLYITNEFESIGDVIDKNIMALAEKMVENSYHFSSNGSKDIEKLHGKISENLADIIKVIRDDDLILADKITKTGCTIRKLETDLREQHFKRLHDGLQESMETSAVHLDLLDNLKRINDHIVYIAYTVLGKI